MLIGFKLPDGDDVAKMRSKKLLDFLFETYDLQERGLDGYFYSQSVWELPDDQWANFQAEVGPLSCWKHEDPYQRIVTLAGMVELDPGVADFAIKVMDSLAEHSVPRPLIYAFDGLITLTWDKDKYTWWIEADVSATRCSIIYFDTHLDIQFDFDAESLTHLGPTVKRLLDQDPDSACALAAVPWLHSKKVDTL